MSSLFVSRKGFGWEWTSTEVAAKDGASNRGRLMAVKGGAFDSPRTSCRTELKGESRAASSGYANVGFRVVREKQGLAGRTNAANGAQKSGADSEPRAAFFYFSTITSRQRIVFFFTPSESG